jgi:tetratricopeptide (TPR) repeat protein
MLWLYGVAWHQPMAQTIAWVQARVAQSLPAAKALFPGDFGSTLQGLGTRSPPAATGAISTGPRVGPAGAGEPVDRELATRLSERRARIAMLSTEGPRQLRAGNARRAMELCRAWTDLELANAEAWRCLGQAAQAAGAYQEALNAFRKAKQFDPGDSTLDAAIERSQRGIVADFLNRNRQ